MLLADDGFVGRCVVELTLRFALSFSSSSLRDRRGNGVHLSVSAASFVGSLLISPGLHLLPCTMFLSDSFLFLPCVICAAWCCVAISTGSSLIAFYIRRCRPFYFLVVLVLYTPRSALFGCFPRCFLTTPASSGFGLRVDSSLSVPIDLGAGKATTYAYSAISL